MKFAFFSLSMPINHSSSLISSQSVVNLACWFAFPFCLQKSLTITAESFSDISSRKDDMKLVLFTTL